MICFCRPNIIIVCTDYMTCIGNDNNATCIEFQKLNSTSGRFGYTLVVSYTIPVVVFTPSRYYLAPYHRRQRVFLVYSPQQPRVVMDTALTGYGCNKSTDHHGDGSLRVSVHLRPSCTVVGSPSLALPEFPPLAVVDWLVGLCTATFVPARKCHTRFNNRVQDKWK